MPLGQWTPGEVRPSFPPSHLSPRGMPAPSKLFSPITLGRGMLFDPRWPWRVAVALNGNAAFPPQYQRRHPTLQGEPIPGNPPKPKG